VSVVLKCIYLSIFINGDDIFCNFINVGVT
jgi:hypothetical protein